MKTSELKGIALDWAVAKAGGSEICYFLDDPFGNDPWLTKDGLPDQPLHSYTPSLNWVQGGLIIEREKLGVWFSENSVDEEGNLLGVAEWYAEDKGGDHVRTGATPLIAAMRCYVASKLGDDIELPEEIGG